MTQEPMRVAYIMSRFPKVTETFILYEMLAVEQENVTLSIYPLMRERGGIVHDEAKPLVDRAFYTPWISRKMLASNLKFFLRKPWLYVSTFFKGLFWTFGSIRFFFGIPAFYLKAIYFADQMQQEKIEHVHAHFVTHPAAVAYIIYQFTGIPYSFTAHGADLQREQEMLCQKVTDAKSIVSVSEYNKQLIIDFCGEQHTSKINIIRCGVDLDRFQQLPKDRENSIFTIVCTGTLHEVKGQRYLIEACSQLRKRGIPFECHFLGDGPDLKMLKDFSVEQGVSENVHWHGYVSQNEVAERLMQADVGILPSVLTHDNLREGIPVSLMEMMACTLPVISSRISGIPELIEDGINGILTEPRDSTAIADALEGLYHDPELRTRLGEAGRQRIFEEFEIHQNARRLTNLFREV